MQFIQQNAWASILATIVVAWLTNWIGLMLLEPVIRRAVRHLHETNETDIKKRQDTLLSLLHAVFKVTVWTIASFLILDKLGLNIATIMASAGVIGVALGFGAQSVIKDFLSGVFIILENQYRVGDVIEIDTASGTVEELTIRSTVLRDREGNAHFIPNGTITHVINKTLDFSKINLTIKVKPDTDLDQLAQLINEIGAELADDKPWKRKITKAPHFDTLGDFTETSLSITIAGTTLPSEQWAVTNELRKRLLAAFRKHKIDLAAS